MTQSRSPLGRKITGVYALLAVLLACSFTFVYAKQIALPDFDTHSKYFCKALNLDPVVSTAFTVRSVTTLLAVLYLIKNRFYVEQSTSNALFLTLFSTAIISLVAMSTSNEINFVSAMSIFICLASFLLSFSQEITNEVSFDIVRVVGTFQCFTTFVLILCLRYTKSKTNNYP